MTQAPSADVARLLEALRGGDAAALDALVPLLYDELRTLAHRQRRRWVGDDTLDTTALVHETYLKLADRHGASWETRAHFMAAAAQAMRHVLINYARDRRTRKRGGASVRVPLDSVEAQEGEADEEEELLLALDTALRELERANARQGRIVECRFFAGMSIAETALALGVSTASVSRGWALAQVRLYEAVRRELRR
ncbi:RNA polymerase sigma factor (plasmid) [Gemmatirosa kalamazoonensis]|uniref:RNA polymerase sigma factor n=1 Tax=Gemmatirosa kalamazoonensis TaxID=861299 RepID=W0RU12_9BACT|nr:ECF-type sigma factor [Gemmatirosa kalamazoonensis]AHG93790.1 RNA polymerase sigma factor [Gemmatirosa kalamazoonensis]